jgi:uncharacterized protein (TIGR03000 family)
MSSIPSRSWAAALVLGGLLMSAGPARAQHPASPPAPVFHPAPVFTHPAPVLSHLAPIFSHPVPTFSHPAPLSSSHQPLFSHPAPSFVRPGHLTFHPGTGAPALAHADAVPLTRFHGGFHAAAGIPRDLFANAVGLGVWHLEPWARPQPHRWYVRDGYLYPPELWIAKTTPKPQTSSPFSRGPDQARLDEYLYNGDIVPADKARVVVILPDAEAQVWFSGQLVYATGTRRTFLTPTLRAGQYYHYAVAAAWQRDGRTVREERTVNVLAGTTSVVDFTRPDDTRRMPPAPAE